MQNTHNYQ